MPKPKNNAADTITDEEFLAAVRKKPHPVAVREAIFEISRKMAKRAHEVEYKGISWANDLDDN